MSRKVYVERIRARLIEAERSGFIPLSREQIRAEIRQEMRRDKQLPEPMPKRKLVDLLTELEPLPSDESLSDVDEGQRPLDRSPLG